MIISFVEVLNRLPILKYPIHYISNGARSEERVR